MAMAKKKISKKAAYNFAEKMESKSMKNKEIKMAMKKMGKKK